MIVVTGLSPAWQRIITFERIVPGEVNRAISVETTASGKAINVARALAALGMAVQVVVPLGGSYRDLIAAQLAREGIKLTTIPVAAPTRVCTTLIEQATGIATELVEPNGEMSPLEQMSYLAALHHAAAQAELLIVTGSKPENVTSDFWRQAVTPIDVPLILDLRGAELGPLLARRPLLVKPNRTELAQTVDRDLSTDAALHLAMRDLHAQGAQQLLITDGGSCVWGLCESRLVKAHVPPVEAINPIGSGDCFLAGWAAAWAAGANGEVCLRQAIAAGAHNAEQGALCSLQRLRLQTLAEQVRIETLED